MRRIKGAAIQAVFELGELGQGESLFGDDDDIAVSIEHNVQDNMVTVEVWVDGPKPEGKTGRGRDIDNLPSAILDAIQGVAFGNDRQVSWLQVKRTHG